MIDLLRANCKQNNFMMRISDQAASLISFSSSPQVKSKLKVDAQKMLQKASPIVSG